MFITESMRICAASEAFFSSSALCSSGSVGEIGGQRIEENAFLDRQRHWRRNPRRESLDECTRESRRASSARRRFQKPSARFVIHNPSAVALFFVFAPPHLSLFKSIPGSSTSLDFMISSQVIS